MRNRANPYTKATTGLMKETRSNPNGAQQPSAKGGCEGNRRRARGPHTTAKRRRRKKQITELTVPTGSMKRIVD
jgi:hypothetical protein